MRWNFARFKIKQTHIRISLGETIFWISIYLPHNLSSRHQVKIYSINLFSLVWRLGNKQRLNALSQITQELTDKSGLEPRPSVYTFKFSDVCHRNLNRTEIANTVSEMYNMLIVYWHFRCIICWWYNGLS